MFYKILSFAMIAFFVMSIVVQFNDPDSLMWVGLYCAVLVATLMTLYKPSPRLFWQLVLLGMVYAGGVFILSSSFKDTSMDAFMAVGMKDMTDEKVRELWGLVICLAWTVVLLFVNGIRPSKQSIHPAGSTG